MAIIMRMVSRAQVALTEGPLPLLFSDSEGLFPPLIFSDGEGLFPPLSFSDGEGLFPHHFRYSFLMVRGYFPRKIPESGCYRRPTRHNRQSQ